MPSIFKIDHSSLSDTVFRKAATIVRNGGTIIYPTETVYGLGAFYLNEDALLRIFSLKKRSLDKPLLLLIHDITDLYYLAQSVSEKALQFCKQYWPGQVTLLFNANPRLSPLLVGSEKKIGCRISSNPVTQKLISCIGGPIASTSANITGGKETCNINELEHALYNSVDVVIDAGTTGTGKPSTIIDVTEEPFRILRYGTIIPDKDV